MQAVISQESVERKHPDICAATYMSITVIAHQNSFQFEVQFPQDHILQVLQTGSTTEFGTRLQQLEISFLILKEYELYMCICCIAASEKCYAYGCAVKFIYPYQISQGHANYSKHLYHNSHRIYRF